MKFQSGITEYTKCGIISYLVWHHTRGLAHFKTDFYLFLSRIVFWFIGWNIWFTYLQGLLIEKSEIIMNEK